MIEQKRPEQKTMILTGIKPHKQLLFHVIFIGCLFITSECKAQNSITSYVETGTSSPVGNFQYGIACQADISLTKHLQLDAGVRFANQFPSGFGTVKAGLVVFPSAKNRRWEINNTFIFTNYAPYPLNEIFYRLTASWHNDHFRIDLGNAFRFMTGDGIFKYALFRPLISLKGTIFKPERRGNLSLFIRNFNRFEPHAQDKVEWGAEVPFRINRYWSIFGESYVNTVGNFNGSANYYNCNMIFGAIFTW